LIQIKGHPRKNAYYRPDFPHEPHGPEQTPRVGTGDFPLTGRNPSADLAAVGEAGILAAEEYLELRSLDTLARLPKREGWEVASKF
jgi:hypothetical protein